VVQRTSSDLRLNPHVHAVFLDGVHHEDATGAVTFRPLGRLTTDDVAEVLEDATRRMTRYLERRGLLVREGDGTEDDRGSLAPPTDSATGGDAAEAEGLLALAGTTATGSSPPGGPAWRRGALPALRGERDFDRHLSAGRSGFTLHAATRAGAKDERVREAAPLLSPMCGAPALRRAHDRPERDRALPPRPRRAHRRPRPRGPEGTSLLGKSCAPPPRWRPRRRLSCLRHPAPKTASTGWSIERAPAASTQPCAPTSSAQLPQPTSFNARPGRPPPRSATGRSFLRTPFESPTPQPPPARPAPPTAAPTTPRASQPSPRSSPSPPAALPLPRWLVSGARIFVVCGGP
jgi:hypothetical protein